MRGVSKRCIYNIYVLAQSVEYVYFYLPFLSSRILTYCPSSVSSGLASRLIRVHVCPEVLKKGSSVHPALLKREVEAVRDTQRSPLYCDQLLQHISSLHAETTAECTEWREVPALSWIIKQTLMSNLGQCAADGTMEHLSLKELISLRWNSLILSLLALNSVEIYFWCRLSPFFCIHSFFILFVWFWRLFLKNLIFYDTVAVF